MNYEVTGYVFMLQTKLNLISHCACFFHCQCVHCMLFCLHVFHLSFIIQLQYNRLGLKNVMWDICVSVCIHVQIVSVYIQDAGTLSF